MNPPAPTSPLPDPADLRIFMWVARLSSFTKAAERLALPRATVSTAIRRLEDGLAARLLQRTTRRVQVTREGEELLDRCERLLEELDEIGGLFRQHGAQLRGRVRVDMPLGMASRIVMPRLPEFIAAHPDVQVDVCSTDRRVDPVADGFDLVIRAGAVVDESLSHLPLPSLGLRSVASATYAAAHGRPATLADLAGHWLINYQPNPASVPAGFEHHDALAGQTLRVPMRHQVTVDNSVAYDAACRAGLGIAQIPWVGVRDELRAGTLVEILPGHRPAAMALGVLFPHRRNIPKRVRVFVQWVGDVIHEAVAGD